MDRVLTTVPESKVGHDQFEHDQDHDEQNHEAQIQSYHTEPQRRDETPQELKWRIRHREGTLRDHQHDTRRMPVARKRLDPAENHPDYQNEQIDQQDDRKDRLQDSHRPALADMSLISATSPLL